MKSTSPRSSSCVVSVSERGEDLLARAQHGLEAQQQVGRQRACQRPTGGDGHALFLAPRRVQQFAARVLDARQDLLRVLEQARAGRGKR